MILEILSSRCLQSEAYCNTTNTIFSIQPALWAMCIFFFSSLMEYQIMSRRKRKQAIFPSILSLLDRLKPPSWYRPKSLSEFHLCCTIYGMFSWFSFGDRKKYIHPFILLLSSLRRISKLKKSDRTEDSFEDAVTFISYWHGVRSLLKHYLKTGLEVLCLLTRLPFFHLNQSS